jgi:TPR repeat protein
LVAALATPSALADVPLERGVQAFEQSRYGDAIAEFRSAANAGDSRAQEILGFMYLHGPNLYGASVPLDRDQAIHWFRHAALGGSEVAKHMLCVLTGRPANTVIHRAGCVKAVSRTSSD